MSFCIPIGKREICFHLISLTIKFGQEGICLAILLMFWPKFFGRERPKQADFLWQEHSKVASFREGMLLPKAAGHMRGRRRSPGRQGGREGGVVKRGGLAAVEKRHSSA